MRRSILRCLLLLAVGFPDGWARAADSPGLSPGVMLRLERARWIQAGDPGASRIIYVFVDTQCTYCRTLWQRMAERRSRVQIRVLLVAVLGPASWPGAAGILQTADPRTTLAAQETNPKARQALAESDIRAETREQIRLNNLFMDALKLPATPGIVYRDGAGAIRAIAGLPEDALLQEILGP